MRVMRQCVLRYHRDAPRDRWGGWLFQRSILESTDAGKACALPRYWVPGVLADARPKTATNCAEAH